MDWFQRWNPIEAPETTTLHAAELTWRGLLPVWLAALLLVAASVGVLFLYRRENARLSTLSRCILAGLRIALIALVLVLLSRPVLIAEFHGERPRGIVLLIDDTQSMKQCDRRVSAADQIRVALARGLLPLDVSLDDVNRLSKISNEELPNPTREELVQAILINPELKLRESLAEKGPLQEFLFDRRLHGQGDAAREPNHTALADSLREVLVRSGGELPAAIVVMTDGRDNASKLTLLEAAQACRDKGVPLYVYGVGSSDGGVLQIKDVALPNTIFVDDKPDAPDDPIDVGVRWRCRGFKHGTVLLTMKLGNQIIRREFPVKVGEDLRTIVTFVPDKSKEGKRAFSAMLELKGDATTRDRWQRTVQVKNNRVKVLYVESVPRREYKFLQPLLDRDRRVLARFFLVEGDPRLAEGRPADPAASLFLDKFPDNFPDPTPRDTDLKPFDLLILGDVSPSSLGPKGVKAIQKFVKEGGGLVVIAGRQHAPADYVDSPLAEVLPIEFTRQTFPIHAEARTQPFKPVLTYDGEQSGTIALADGQEDNLRLWKEDLWKDGRGFHWFYPVGGLRPAATALLVHPELRTGQPPNDKPMSLLAFHYYGKGEVLFLGIDETWRWRDGTGDRLTSRFWGQIVTQLGLPHLLGHSRRVQLELERGEAMLGRPGTVKARLLDKDYEPLTRPSVRAVLVHTTAGEGQKSEQPIELKHIKSMPGEYRAALPNDTPGQFELRLDEAEGLESSSLSYRVEQPPGHETEIAGMAEEALRAAARTSGGQFYREEDLRHLAKDIEPRTLPFVLRQEILLWSPLSMLLFVALITAEWVLRKFSNLS
ncbi:MAG: VWA domain-containing protein [Gemmataceae bacterium]